MRTNVEDTIRTSGKLGKVARLMGWNDREAMGALVFFWKSTQASGIIEDSRSRIVNCFVADMDSDAQAELFLDALIAARLATETETGLCIEGNAQHVERLSNLRGNASLGGKAKAKSSMVSLASAKQMPSICLAPGCPPTPPPSPTPTDLTTSAKPDVVVDEAGGRKRKPPHPDAKRLRDLWCELFHATAMVEFSDHGAGFNATIADLCKRFNDSPGEAERVIRAFFATQDRWVREEMRWGWRALGSKIDALRQEGIKRPSSRSEKLRAEIEKQDREMRAMMAMPSEVGESSSGEAF